MIPSGSIGRGSAGAQQNDARWCGDVAEHRGHSRAKIYYADYAPTDTPVSLFRSFIFIARPPGGGAWERRAWDGDKGKRS